MIKIGVIGYGYWGPNIVRNFSAIDGVEVVSVCDKDPKALERAKKTYPQLKICRDDREITRSKDIDTVAIVTPVFTHFALAKEALKNGKHIFVEKPFTSNSRQAEELISLAKKNNLKVMVDHTFIFTGAVRKIKELIDNNTLGRLYYYDSTRINLGLFQHDVNVIWDLAPHDLAIMDYVIKERPSAISAVGAGHFSKKLENIAYIVAHFDNNIIAHFNVNWLSPVKVRTTLIGGEKKMLVWDDLETDEKIKIYDKGVKVESREGVYRLLVEYRSGDIHSPRIDHTEALKLETEYFIDCILKNKAPVNDGYTGLRIVKMLEAADKSLKNKGAPVKL
ncbi:MAG: Gfo/Idh/MocA family oxidoreductase [Candidatus Omnitrophota bacterium]|nr:Gfo/Idh/MocA family oxidoreductase [Candidatus Omnitrophota bacterium]